MISKYEWFVYLLNKCWTVRIKLCWCWMNKCWTVRIKLCWCWKKVYIMNNKRSIKLWYARNHRFIFYGSHLQRRECVSRAGIFYFAFLLLSLSWWVISQKIQRRGLGAYNFKGIEKTFLVVIKKKLWNFHGCCSLSLEFQGVTQFWGIFRWRFDLSRISKVKVTNLIF